jgi:hypothetical protein
MGEGVLLDLVAFVGDGVASVGGAIPACLVIVALVCFPLAFVGEPVPLILGGLAFVGQAVTFVGVVVTFVGQSFTLVRILVRLGAGYFTSLGGPVALGSRHVPPPGLDGSGSSTGLALSVGPVALVECNLAALFCLSPVPGDLLPDRPSRLGLLSHPSTLHVPLPTLRRRRLQPTETKVRPRINLPIRRVLDMCGASRWIEAGLLVVSGDGPDRCSGRCPSGSGPSPGRPPFALAGNPRTENSLIRFSSVTASCCTGLKVPAGVQSFRRSKGSP